jgi:Cu(I)-responsive transcriptional regulator
MNIGEAARRSGVSAKMVRYYESIGLIGPASRTMAGYRTYSDEDVHRLRFIRRARDLGFPMPKIAGLLELWTNRRRSSAKVKEIALEHIGELKRQIAEAEAMLQTLQRLAHSCHGDERESCPIIDDLAQAQRTARSAPRATKLGARKAPAV